MPRPRIMIADTDINYVIPLQIKFVEEYFEKVDLEIITDPSVFQEVFSVPQRADILIVSEELYDPSLQRHNIGNIILMTERDEAGKADEISVVKIYKYTDIKRIFSQIMGTNSNAFGIEKEKQTSQIILVSSASGGVGKTTVALGLCACLAAENQKRVLYINADYLQSYQNQMNNQLPITDQGVYARLANAENIVYEDVRRFIRKELFYYLPPFKAALISLGIDFSAFINLAVSAKNTNEYDFIVVDAEASFNEYKVKLLNIADKVIVVTNQSRSSVLATNRLAGNINGISNEKYIFVCNAFDDGKDNALVSKDVVPTFTVNEYIEFFPHYEQMKIEDYIRSSGMEKMAFLVM